MTNTDDAIEYDYAQRYVLARVKAITLLEAGIDNPHAADETRLLQLVGTHWIRYCTSAELRRIQQGACTADEFIEMEERYHIRRT